MEKVCVVDFDQTLLTVDSTIYLIMRERLYLRLPVLFWGVLFLLVRAIFPRSAQVAVRRHAKYAVLRALSQISEGAVVEKYSKLLTGLLNLELLENVRRNYQTVYVVSSAWQPLIEATLAAAGTTDFKIFGTQWTLNFQDFSICWHEGKADVVRRLGLSGFDLYTDSEDDRPLMKLASKVIIV